MNGDALLILVICGGICIILLNNSTPNNKTGEGQVKISNAKIPFAITPFEGLKTKQIKRLKYFPKWYPRSKWFISPKTLISV